MVSTHEKAEQYLHVAKQITAAATYITTGLCLTTAIGGSATSLLVTRVFNVEQAMFGIPVSIVVPVLIAGWFYSSVISPANAVIASGDAISKLSTGDPKQFVHSIVANFEGFLTKFTTAGLTGTLVLLGAALMVQQPALRVLLLVFGGGLGLISGGTKLMLPKLFNFGEQQINQVIAGYRKKTGI